MAGSVGGVIQRYLAATIIWGHHTAQELGLSSTEFATLVQLNQAPASPAELARTTGLSAAAVSRMVERLVERGYAERVADPSDRRRILIHRTDNWQARIDEAVEPHRRAMRELFGDLEPEAVEQVLTYMERAEPMLRELAAR
ncbi:MarR family winged helix-turn-helix transcriptional regulator [Naumannella halotolerans]|uniref:DNA-binding MarR family transcriptional regulator n=1 Tax=Naumannella halotolerans TaxID=993414 RepID=A0A4R7JBA4_9ACTN|nr:MarR family transcriptional regulator [Naumannella halotolerans]TDT33883.1 DNA-binding MarR family transcriptional regulator [Naumannella halotolerans]